MRWVLVIAVWVSGCDLPTRTVSVRSADAADGKRVVVAVEDRTERRRGFLTGPFPEGDYTRLLRKEWVVSTLDLSSGRSRVVARFDGVADSIGAVGVDANGRFALAMVSHQDFGRPPRVARLDLDTGGLEWLRVASTTGCPAWYSYFGDAEGTVVVACDPRAAGERGPQADPFPLWVSTTQGWTHLGDVWSYGGGVDGWLYFYTARPWAYWRVHPRRHIREPVERRAYWSALDDPGGVRQSGAGVAYDAGVGVRAVPPNALVVDRRVGRGRPGQRWTPDTVHLSPRRLAR